MKIQLLISDGDRQIIITPSSEEERGILKTACESNYDVVLNMVDTQIRMCQAGWYRSFGYGGFDTKDDSLVITMTRKKGVSKISEA